MARDTSSAWEDIQGSIHPGFGECIYCGSDGGSDGLRDEHIIPFSLGGKAVIRGGSCRTCERLISPIDTHLGRSVYGRHRIHIGVPTRNRKDRPTTLPAIFQIAANEVVKNLPIKDHPYTLALPVWGDPGFFRQARIDEPMPEPRFNLYHFLPTNIRDTLQLGEDEEFRVWEQGRTDVSLFARAMAKIAYCHMVLRYGLDGFRRLVIPDLILGKFSGIAYFVGSPLEEPPPKSSHRVLHAIQFTEFSSARTQVYMVSIRLFAHSGTSQHGVPFYRVLVGAPKAASAKPRS